VEIEELRRARATLESEEPIKQLDESGLQEVLGLFPGARWVENPSFPEYDSEVPEGGLVFDIDTSLRALKKAPKGASPSFGLRMEHLSYWSRHGAAESVAVLASLFAQRKAPGQIAPFISGGSLTLFAKKEGGGRPVVPADSVVKHASNCARHSQKEARQAAVAPHHFGDGLQGGAQLMGNTTTLIAQQHPDWAVAKVDAKNGYGTILRAAIRAELAKKGLQAASVIFEAKYGRAVMVRARLPDGSFIWLEVIDSILQGDVDGPFFYCIGTAPALVATKAQLSEGEVMAYLDDGLIAAPPADMPAAVRTYSIELAKAGPRVSLSKSGWSSRAGPREIDLVVLVGEEEHSLPFREEGLTIVGVPALGGPAYRQAVLDDVLSRSNRALERLPWLVGRQQHAFLLLRSASTRCCSTSCAPCCRAKPGGQRRHLTTRWRWPCVVRSSGQAPSRPQRCAGRV
jgi:hypothetical protein